MTSNIVIVGGGLAGAAQGLALASKGIPCTVLDAQSPDPSPMLDGRLLAISKGSAQQLLSYGLEVDFEILGEPIREIIVSDQGSPQLLHFDQTIAHGPMGYMVEIQILRTLLLEKVRSHPLIQWKAPCKVTDIAPQELNALVTTDDGSVLAPKLVIGADGKNSPIRDRFNLKTRSWSYDHTAIVCGVEHPKNHEGRAFEHFLPQGPFAVLPMGGGYQSSIVWSESSRLAPHYLDLSEDDFNWELNKRFQALGDLKVLNNKRWSYPLSGHILRSFIAPRVALVGDAAHGIHPIAGQGINLGFRDVEDLSQRIQKYLSLGLDIGGDTLLQEYQWARRGDHAALVGSTDILTRLYSNSSLTLKFLRNTGVGIVESCPPLKSFFVRHAMGYGGTSRETLP